MILKETERLLQCARHARTHKTAMAIEDFPASFIFRTDYLEFGESLDLLRKTVSGMLTLLLIGMLILAFNVLQVRADGSWVWVRNTVTGSYGEAVVGTGTALYIARGSSFYRYLPVDNSFVELASPPKPDGYAFKTGTALAWDFGDYIYALFGAATGDSRRWFYRYSISNNSWEALANTPVDHGEGDAITWVARPYNCIYATIGGEQRPTFLMRYYPLNNSWGPEFPVPGIGMGDGASLVWAGRDCLYALRGEYYEEEPLYDFWCINLTSSTLTSLADIPATPHSGGSGGVGDGGSLLYIGFWMTDQTDYIYALSGNQAYPDGIPDDRTYKYTISTNTWECLADLPFGVGYYVGCRLGFADGHIYAWQGAPSTWEGGGDDLATYEFPTPPTVEVPLFELLGKEVREVDGGMDVTLTFRNYGFDATSGTVWIPWEKVWYSTELRGSPPSGNITENLLQFDVNGDGDTADVFTVHYIDNKTVEVDGVTAHALFIPEQRIRYDEKGIYDVLEKNSFRLGLKNHTLDKVSYFPEYGYGYAGFGIDSFFRYHPSPNIEFVIEQVGESINSTSTAEIVGVKLNGASSPYEFNFISPWLDGGQWYVDNAYVYPLGFLNSNAVFTVQVSIRGEPGSYLLNTILNWAPESLHRYRYFVFDAVETPFAITGTLQRTITFEDKDYPIDIVTNSTISESPLLNVMAKEICFNATGYGVLTFFWNITIPQNLLTDNPWTITIDGTSVPYTSTTNGSHTFLFFKYTYNEPYFKTRRISIIGTQVIPEFPSIMIPPLFMLTASIVTVLLKKKRKTKP